MVVGDPTHARDDVGEKAAAAAVEDADAVERGARRDAIVRAECGASAVRAMPVAVLGFVIIIHKVKADADASCEFIVGGVDTGVDDVDVDPRAGGVVTAAAVHAVQGRRALVDAVKAPEPGIKLTRRCGRGQGRSV